MPISAVAMCQWQMLLHKVRDTVNLHRSAPTVAFCTQSLSTLFYHSDSHNVHKSLYFSFARSISLSLFLTCQCFIRRDILLSGPVTSSITSPSNQLCPNEFYWQLLKGCKQVCVTSRGRESHLWVVESDGNAQSEELIHRSLDGVVSSYCPGASVIVSLISPRPQSVEFTMSSQQEI